MDRPVVIGVAAPLRDFSGVVLVDDSAGTVVETVRPPAVAVGEVVEYGGARGFRLGARRRVSDRRPASEALPRKREIPKGKRYERMTIHLP